MEIVGLNVGNYIVGQILAMTKCGLIRGGEFNIANGVARPQIFA